MQGGKARALVLVPPWGALHNAPEHREDPKSKRALSHSVESDKQARRGAHDPLVTHQRQSLHPSQKACWGDFWQRSCLSHSCKPARREPMFHLSLRKMACAEQQGKARSRLTCHSSLTQVIGDWRS